MKNKHFIGLYFRKNPFCLKKKSDQLCPLCLGWNFSSKQGKEALSGLNVELSCRFLDFQANSLLLVPMEFLFKQSPFNSLFKNKTTNLFN